MKPEPRSPGLNKGRGREHDRHSATGTRGLPKKNGAGGKTVWGGVMDQVTDGAPVAYLDKKDPNYDSADEALPNLNLTPPNQQVVEPKADGAVASDGAAAAAADPKDADSESSSPEASKLPTPGPVL